MASFHIYAPAHGKSNHVLQSLSNQRGRKRRRGAEDDDESEPDEDAQFTSTARSEDGRSRASSRSLAESYASFTANQLEQLRTAGLEPGDENPKAPFPHRSASPPRNTLLEVKTELQELNPPLAHVDPMYYEALPFKANDEQETLRSKHLGVLVAIMHSMLAKQDFQRAGKAWGLLLRSGYMSRTLNERAGHQGMDVRTNDRWGIGAEILMRGGFEDPQPVRNEPAVLSRTATASQLAQPEGYAPQFLEEGFKKARQYYERLIVQYPEHHKRKGASASSFYGAMFSLWIFEVNEKSKRARDKVMKDSDDRKGSNKVESQLSSSLGNSRSSSDGTPTPVDELLLENIKSKELEEAEEIATKMDGVLVTPPFDKNAELLHLRGMVALWLGDLKGDRTSGIEKAEEYFARSHERGGRLWKGIQNINIRSEG
jgi:hypothetical protein